MVSVLGSLCLTSCFIYPFGWSNNSEINQICGDERRCEIGWAYVLTVAGGVISIVLSGMPNLLQSLLNRNSQTQNRLPMISSTVGKYPLITQNNLPRMTHSWYNPDNSVFVNGNSVSERVRRRPQSLVVSPDPNAMWDFSRRLSCSVFGSIPEHGQNELVSNNLSVSQSFGTLPENDTTLKVFADSKKDQQASCQKSDSAENTS
ncbi:unnamed protein product [Hymenolepis diminuta]|uniref:Frizzled domain-containing protein n=1 Tax=Hymenolepis diminuta TaxID=6216 RepID=A0A0R3SSQ1_HYMDI|nr:unnamed protein product [Hymenolepis diminuta]